MTPIPSDDTVSNELDLYKSKLKLAKKDKASVAVQFKNAVPGSEQHAHLIEQMQLVSSELKQLESKIKSIETDLSARQKSPIIEDLKSPPLLTIDQSNICQQAFTIRELANHEVANWYSFVQSITNATAYHQRAWAEIIGQSFKKPTRIWVALDSTGSIIGGIPLVFFNSILFGKFAVSIPYLNYGGVLTTYFNVAQQLLNHLTDICKSESLSYIEVRTMQPNLGPSASSKKASMILQLPNSIEKLDSNLGAKVRAQYKKCEEHNPVIQVGRIELLDDFYSVFARNMRDLGTPVYSKAWFANILNNASINSALAIVYVKRKPVSAGFLIGHNGMLEIPWASTIKEANALNTNMWMYRKILDFAIEQKFDFFDFGRSTQDAGTYKFKKQWGSTPYIHYWYKILPSEDVGAPELNPDNPKFSLMIAAWKKMPVWLSKIIGPLIIRDIP